MEIKDMKTKGFSLVELIIAIGVFAILGAGVFNVVTNTYSNYYGTGDRQTVTEFAQEGIEAVRAIRDNSWSDIYDEVGNTKGVSKDGDGYWQFGGSSDSLDSLTRTIDISLVDRDINNDIVASGTTDINTVKVAITVSGTGMDNYVLTTYISNWSVSEWEQENWAGSGSSTFWRSATIASTTSNIVTSTANEISIAQVPSGFDDWDDLTEIASSTMGGVVYDFDFSSDNKTIYVVGDYNHEFRAYDISDVRSGTITHSWTLDLNNNMNGGLSVVVNPNDDYAYVGAVFSYTGSHTIAIVNLNTHVASYRSTGITFGRINDLVIDSSGSYLYALGAYGRLYIFSIRDSGYTLTLENSGQKTTNTGKIPCSLCPPLNKGYLESVDEEYLYIVTDDPNTTFAKLDITDETNAVKEYVFTDSADFEDIRYLEINGDYIRFLVSTENKNNDEEFRIIEDDTELESLSEVDSYSLSGSSYVSTAHDTDGVAFMYNSVGDIYSIDVSDVDNLSAGPLSDTSHYSASPSSLPFNYMKYSSSLGGLFLLEKETSPTAYVLNFIERPYAYEYASTGSLTSSIYDIGSTNQELYSITVTQNVPSGCDIDITLQASDDYSFASLENNVFSDNSVSSFTSIIPDSLNGKRYLRYIADLTSCNSGADTPTLYSVKLRYK